MSEKFWSFRQLAFREKCGLKVQDMWEGNFYHYKNKKDLHYDFIIT